jgi:hypothetical protein
MRIVQGGINAFNGLAYGEQSNDVIDFFRTQASNIPTLMGRYADNFKTAISDLYNTFYNDTVLQAARLAIHHAGSAATADCVKLFSELVHFQTASPLMQRYIMAEPTIRDAYHKQRIDGYSETYVDAEPGKIGDAHYDYRRIMTGIVHEDKEGNDKCTIWVEDLRYDDARPLMIQEQAAILTNHEIARALFKNGQLLTDQYGGLNK